MIADFVYVRWLGDHNGIEALTTTWDKTVIDRTNWAVIPAISIEESTLGTGRERLSCCGSGALLILSMTRPHKITHACPVVPIPYPVWFLCISPNRYPTAAFFLQPLPYSYFDAFR